jgi:hypothetical protein
MTLFSVNQHPCLKMWNSRSHTYIEASSST